MVTANEMLAGTPLTWAVATRTPGTGMDNGPAPGLAAPGAQTTGATGGAGTGNAVPAMLPARRGLAGAIPGPANIVPAIVAGASAGAVIAGAPAVARAIAGTLGAAGVGAAPAGSDTGIKAKAAPGAAAAGELGCASQAMT